MPLAFGLLRPGILLPSTASTWPTNKLRLVLSHELAHIKRHDCLTQTLAQLARAIHWFNPLAYLAVWRMRTERERACDDLVLRATSTRPSDYADTLLHLTSSLHPAPAFLPAMPMARPSHLHTRLRDILNPGLNRSPLTRRLTIAALLLAPAIALPLSCSRSENPQSPHPIPFNPGDSSFLPGDSITIDKVLDVTPPAATDFHTYQVAGTYTLVSHDSAILGCYITSSDPNSGTGSTTPITKGTAPFSLSFIQRGNGFPHISFYPVNGGNSFGGVYFGSGPTLLKHQPASRKSE